MSERASVSAARALLHVVVLAVLAGVLVTIWLALAYDAGSYYAAPLTRRGLFAVHRVLRPSGSAGHLLGLAGTLFLVSTFFYVARRRLKFLAKAGSPARWLEVHIFCGVFGPVLITLHTSIKFNGVVSVAYWSMVLVVASGFVGRYLYVRIPKTIRGEELTNAELEQQAAELRARLAETRLPPRLIAQIDDEERLMLASASAKRSLMTRIRDASAGRRRASALRREIRASGLERHLLHDALALARERAVLLQRIARLKKTRQLFQLWHVFHRPAVWVMFWSRARRVIAIRIAARSSRTAPRATRKPALGARRSIIRRRVSGSREDIASWRVRHVIRKPRPASAVSRCNARRVTPIRTKDNSATRARSVMRRMLSASSAMSIRVSLNSSAGVMLP